MKKPIQISIPTPCNENWDAMSPEAKGRFCASCQKTVIDFTHSSDREIATVLKNNNNACGRFRSNQLERELVVPKEKSSVWMAASAAVVSFLTIGNDVVSAQTPTRTEQVQIKHIVGKPAFIPDNQINGTVISDTDKQPLPGVVIVNKNSHIEAQADVEGRFTIEAKKGDTLEFSYLSYNVKTVKIDEQKNIIITIYESPAELMGDIYIEKKRTFFGRIFHSIGSIFR